MSEEFPNTSVYICKKCGSHVGLISIDRHWCMKCETRDEDQEGYS